MENLREVLEQNERRRAERRGSVFMSVLIILIFAIGAIFYVKTAKPQLFTAAVQCVKEVYQDITKKDTPPPETQTLTLRSADTLKFEYLSKGLTEKFKTDSFCAFPLKNAVVTSEFGGRTDPVTGAAAGHHGIDLAAPEESEILCYSDGTVLSCDYDDIYGNCVLVQNDGFQSFYAHLSTIFVKNGEKVRSGQPLGIIGSTGKSTGTHLHFEIREDGRAVDPAPYLYEKI
ncbi:MAG: M23 family metallopeptidase [Clostridia bacterium]|nr:M23 family metallopeptidase [Clostridia bacterium]